MTAGLPGCPACHGTGVVTEDEHDKIVAALEAAEGETEE